MKKKSKIYIYVLIITFYSMFLLQCSGDNNEGNEEFPPVRFLSGKFYCKFDKSYIKIISHNELIFKDTSHGPTLFRLEYEIVKDYLVINAGTTDAYFKIISEKRLVYFRKYTSGPYKNKTIQLIYNKMQ